MIRSRLKIWGVPPIISSRICCSSAFICGYIAAGQPPLGVFRLLLRTRWCVLASCLLWTALPASTQQGYDIVDDRIVVSGRSHWQHWKKPEHLTTIDNSGAVRPRHLRSIYNVLADPSIARPVVITNKDRRIPQCG